MLPCCSPDALWTFRSIYRNMFWSSTLVAETWPSYRLCCTLALPFRYKIDSPSRDLPYLDRMRTLFANISLGQCNLNKPTAPLAMPKMIEKCAFTLCIHVFMGLFNLRRAMNYHLCMLRWCASKIQLQDSLAKEPKSWYCTDNSPSPNCHKRPLSSLKK